MSDQHKPTVGELADEIEAAYHELPFDYDRMRFKLWLREKINAALAAEREKCKLWESRYYETNEALEKTQEELAVEREQVKVLVDALKEIAHEETISSYVASLVATNLAKVAK